MAIFGPKADKVLEHGTTRQGTLTGIRHEYSYDDGSTTRSDYYAVRLDSGTTVGVGQSLDPDDCVRLGMVVVVRDLDGKVFIDWTATVARAGVTGSNDTRGWKALKKPPDDGIFDESVDKAIKKGTTGTFVITAIQDREVMFGLGSATDFEGVVSVPGDEPYVATVAKVAVPGYVSHLPTVGTELICAVGRRLDKPTIDWQASAMRRPGVGEPPVMVGAERNEMTSMRSDIDAVTPIEEQLAAAANSGDTIGGITIDTFAAIHAGIQHDRVRPADCDAYATRFGVAPGGWADVETQWHAAIRNDWRVGAAYGEAISVHQRELKKRR